MTLLNETYRREVLGALRAAGDDFLAAFLQVPARELARRIHACYSPRIRPKTRTLARSGLSKIEEAIAITKRLSPDALTLQAGGRSPSQLADEVLTHISRPDTAGQPGVTQSSPALTVSLENADCDGRRAP
jgi:hypothetical protein